MSEDATDKFLQESVAATSTPRPTFDDVLAKLGNPGRFQLTQIALSLNAQLVMAFLSFSFVFLGYEPAHVCNQQGVNETSLLEQHGLLNDSTATVSYRSCDLLISSNQTGRRTDLHTTSCPQGRNFSHNKHTTWLSHWDLVCESRGPAEVSFSVYNIGWIIGGLIASNLADRFGRRIVFLIGYFSCFCSELSIIFAPNIYVIIALRFLSGAGRACVTATYYVICVELIVPRHREFCGMVMCVLWIFQVMVVGVVAFIFENHHWRFVQGSAAASAVFSIVYPFFLSESPRWLTAKRRYKEALVVLERACKQDGKNFEEVKSLYHLSISEEKEDEHVNSNGEDEAAVLDVDGRTNKTRQAKTKTGNQKGSLLTLLSHKDLLIVTLSTTFVGIANCITYLGLYMTSSALVGNRFLNYCLMCLVEIPSSFLLYFMMKRMGRLLVLRFFLGLALLALLCSSLLMTVGKDLSSAKALITVLFILGTFAMTSSYSLTMIISPEIFPTSLRSTGDAFVVSFSRLGSLLVPFLRPFMSTVEWGPAVIFTAFCAIALVLTVFVPETKDQRLLDFVADFQKSLKRKRQEKRHKKTNT